MNADRTTLERNTWIINHGSDFLREALTAQINLDIQYYFERVSKIVWDLKIDNLEVRKAVRNEFSLGLAPITNSEHVSLDMLKSFNQIKDDQPWEELGCEIELRRDSIMVNFEPPNVYVAFYKDEVKLCTIHLGKNEAKEKPKGQVSRKVDEPYTWNSVCAFFLNSLANTR